MKSFRAKLTIYFDLKHQENLLDFIKNSKIKNISYDIKNIHKHKFYDIYDKDNKHSIYDYYENNTLLSLSIFSDELSNINYG